MKIRLLTCLFFLRILLLKNIAFGQNYSFSRIGTVDLKGGYLGFASWCDFNSDGRMDVFVTGLDFGGDFKHALFYKNDGNNTFSETQIKNIPRVIYGSHSWGDYDNDGNIDLLYSGTKSGMSEDNITKLYRNNGNDSFTEININLIQVGEGDVDFVDLNNDGKTDLFLMGVDNYDQFNLAVYKNKGNSVFEYKNVSIARISGKRGNFSKCESRWADFDNDGLKDLVVSMSTASDFSFRFYKNLGNFEFQEVQIGLPRLNYISMAVGDINQDGLIDIVYVGSSSQRLSWTEQNNMNVLVNKGNLKFENTQSIQGVGVFWNNMDIADYTNDGYPDIIYHGSRENKEINIYSNNKNNTFAYTFHHIMSCEEGGSLFGDINNNNVLDILHYGRMKYPYDFEATYVYENTIGIANGKPLPPSELQMNAFKNDISFSWNHGTDDSTKSAGLYYNVRLGTKTSPDSLIAGNSTDTNLKFYHWGNVNKNRELKYKHFPEGRYMFNVQTIDNSYNVSRYSEPLEFCFKHSKGVFQDTITICSGDSVKLDPGEGFKGYKWNTGAQERVFYAKNAGQYNLILTDQDNCLRSETVFLKVKNKPEIDLGKDTTACIGDTISFQVPKYKQTLWSNNSAETSINVTETGKYRVWVTGFNNCVATDSVYAQFNAVPGVNLGNDTCLGFSDTLVLAVAGNYSSYLWSNGSKNVNMPVIAARAKPGPNIFWLKVTDGFGCSNTDTILVSINPFVKIDVYPVPFKNELNIRFDKRIGGKTIFEILDLNGKLIYKSESNGTIDFQKLEVLDPKKGLYFLRIRNELNYINQIFKIAH